MVLSRSTKIFILLGISGSFFVVELAVGKSARRIESITGHVLTGYTTEMLYDAIHLTNCMLQFRSHRWIFGFDCRCVSYAQRYNQPNYCIVRYSSKSSSVLHFYCLKVKTCFRSFPKGHRMQSTHTGGIGQKSFLPWLMAFFSSLSASPSFWRLWSDLHAHKVCVVPGHHAQTPSSQSQRNPRSSFGCDR